jgi:hypothetical protein
MRGIVLLPSLRYFGAFQLASVVLVIVLSSVGAFFHFLLDHEISIVEAWLHNNHWEILIGAKLLALFLLNRWFRMRLYEMKSIRELVRELVRWPEPKAVVVAVFAAVSYLSLAGASYAGQNLGYWYYHLTSFVGLFLYFGIDFVVIAYLDDVYRTPGSAPGPEAWLAAGYTVLFTTAFRLSVPDYYDLVPYTVFCFSTLLYVSGRAFRGWSNAVCFLLVFVAPMGSVFGLDPVWGDDFSLFAMKSKLALPFLAAIWMVSFCYYKYRDRLIFGARKLVR